MGLLFQWQVHGGKSNLQCIWKSFRCTSCIYHVSKKVLISSFFFFPPSFLLPSLLSCFPFFRSLQSFHFSSLLQLIMIPHKAAYQQPNRHGDTHVPRVAFNHSYGPVHSMSYSHKHWHIFHFINSFIIVSFIFIVYFISFITVQAWLYCTLT